MMLDRAVAKARPPCGSMVASRDSMRGAHIHESATGTAAEVFPDMVVVVDSALAGKYMGHHSRSPDVDRSVFWRLTRFP